MHQAVSSTSIALLGDIYQAVVAVTAAAAIVTGAALAVAAVAVVAVAAVTAWGPAQHMQQVQQHSWGALPGSPWKVFDFATLLDGLSISNKAAIRSISRHHQAVLDYLL